MKFFSFKYLQNIKEHELAESLRPVGFQSKQAKDEKRPLVKLQMILEERFQARKELQKIYGIGQKSLLILEEIVGVSSSRMVVFHFKILLNLFHLCRAFWLILMSLFGQRKFSKWFQKRKNRMLLPT